MSDQRIKILSTGVFGPEGPPGPAGEAGANGTAGMDGLPGPTGATGTAGADGTNGADGQAHTFLSYSQVGEVTVGTGNSNLNVPKAATIVGAVASVSSAPAGAALIVDINVNGSSIYSNQAHRPTIADGALLSQAVQTPDVTSLAAGDVLTVDRDQIGSNTPGSNLVVTVDLLVSP